MKGILAAFITIFSCLALHAQDARSTIPIQNTPDRDYYSSESDIPEIFENYLLKYYYRAPRGAAFLVLENMNNWDIRITREPDASIIRLSGTIYIPKSSSITIAISSKKFSLKTVADMQKVLAYLVDSLKKTTPWLSEKGGPAAGKANGAVVIVQNLEGKNEVGKVITANYILVSEGTSVVSLFGIAAQKEFNTVKSKEEQIIDTLKMGRNIPWLGNRSPQKKIEGTYCGYSRDKSLWMVFDRRGYIWNGAPEFMGIDADFRLQSLGQRYIRGYDVSGNRISTYTSSGNRDVDYMIEGNTVVSQEGVRFHRADGRSGHITLDGPYKVVTSGSFGSVRVSGTNRYIFTADGKFQYSKETTFVTTYDPEIQKEFNIENWSTVGSGKPLNGTYRIEKDRLTLSSGDGKHTLTYPFFLKPDKNGAFPADIKDIIINGIGHWREK